MSNVPGTTDIVGIFRPSKDVPPVGENMLRKEGFKVIWMTEGIFSRV